MNPVEIKRGDNFQKLSNYLLKGKSQAPSPEKILEDISNQNSVFTQQDIELYLKKYIEDPTEMSRAINKVLASPDLVVMRSNKPEDERRYYSTWEMVSIEKNMMEASDRLSQEYTHDVNETHVDNALRNANEALEKVANAQLSEEQIEAIKHVTSSENLSVVSGLAGAGKSTMLSAAREAWEAEGYQVYGTTLAGKAAEGLQESSKIPSRTLASFEYGWKNGYGELTKNDVLVIDEAGMVGSRQLARFVDAAEKSGAKLVLVGDSEQLQAIGAGAPFRQSVDKHGAAELEHVLRQRKGWQKTATKDFAQDRTAEGLSAYEKNGSLGFYEDSEQTVNSLAEDYLADLKKHPEQTRLALAHRRVDVKAINHTIRDTRRERHEIGQGVAYKTDQGKQEFSVGDRLIFLENNRDLGVKNGMLGTVIDIQNGVLTTQIDGKAQRTVQLSEENYAAIGYGYASTIHKSQGMTVDRSYVMASYTMDRHLSYVAMSRHREEAKLYVNGKQFHSLESLATRLGREGLKRSTLDYEVEVSQSMKPSIQTVDETKKVGWTQTYNLGDTSDINAWMMMKATARSADDLKRMVVEEENKKRKKKDQQQFRGGNTCKKPVYHFTITWPKDDAPSEKLQRKAVNEALKVLDMEHHQALAVQHLDRNPHVHIMLNLIDPETGMSASTPFKLANGEEKASKLSFSKKKLRQWANRFEKANGLQITEGSHRNEERRQAGEKVDARRKSRAAYNRQKREGKLIDLSGFKFEEPLVRQDYAAMTEKEKSYTAKDLGLMGEHLATTHKLERQQLNTAYEEQMAKLYDNRLKEIDRQTKIFTARFKQQWTALARSKHQRLRQFDKAEQTALGAFSHSVQAYFMVKKEKQSLLKGLYAATSTRERRELFNRLINTEFRQLGEKERMECTEHINTSVLQVYMKKFEKARKDYISEDLRLNRMHKKQVGRLHNRWRNYDRGRATKAEQSLTVRKEAVVEQNVEQGYGQKLGYGYSPD
ncbi:MAG: hypothetical protein NPIRA05_11930 [Nitrospirales bacterium]|nr:MAG: hypothetical protein NPIRA05_11930 [Nitrospirales bacterium]